MVASEALVRIAANDGSLRLPEQFVEIAELTGLIPELDLQMLYLAGELSPDTASRQPMVLAIQCSGSWSISWG